MRNKIFFGLSQNYVRIRVNLNRIASDTCIFDVAFG